VGNDVRRLFDPHGGLFLHFLQGVFAAPIHSRRARSG
jgi:hypothetical protein